MVNQGILMFGGMIEITKEVNDTYRYDVPTNTWQNLRTCPPAQSIHPEEVEQSTPMHRSRNSPLSHHSTSKKMASTSRIGG